MVTRKGPLLCLALVALVVASATSAGAEAAEPARTAPDDPLARLVDLSLEDATIHQAVTALRLAGGPVAGVEGNVAERKVSLQVKAMPARDVLDAFAALYGLVWEPGLTMVLFKPRRAAPGKDDAVRGSMPETITRALELLTELGIGKGQRPLASDRDNQECQAALAFTASAIPPDVQKRMAEASRDDLRKMGVRIRDLPADVQQRLLGWQARAYLQSVSEHLWNAAQPFDTQRMLDATVYIEAPAGDRKYPLLWVDTGGRSTGYTILPPDR